MKRFYKEVALGGATAGAIEVLLDGRPVKTPEKRALQMPSTALAEAVAAEWTAQEETIRPAAMPMTRLASTAVDRVIPRRGELIEDIMGYAGSDLVCYRAPHPPDLVEKQKTVWQPLVDWAALSLDAPLEVTQGIIPVGQKREAMTALESAVGRFDDWSLTGIAATANSTGSLIIALALGHRQLDGPGAYEAAMLDELHQASLWGEDEEAAERRQAIRADIEEAARFLELVSSR